MRQSGNAVGSGDPHFIPDAEVFASFHTVGTLFTAVELDRHLNGTAHGANLCQMLASDSSRDCTTDARHRTTVAVAYHATGNSTKYGAYH